MSRRILVIALVGFTLVGGGWAVWLWTRPPAPVTGRSVSPTQPTARVDSPAAAAPAPPPAPERRPAPRAGSNRRTPPPKTAPLEPEAAAAVGTLHIDSDIAGAQVFIDRNYIGVTPLTAPDVSVGAHRLNIVAPGYESIAESVDVEPGPRDLRFNFKEVRLDAAVDVVHKHRIGSCKGRLVATPQGLRYETDDKNDRFSSALGDLEVFEVDYLAKVLRVKLVKGKRYEFTDPGASNADRLFVFHRDVDKVRQRLKQGG
jgi:PEGA domain